MPKKRRGRRLVVGKASFTYAQQQVLVWLLLEPQMTYKELAKCLFMSDNGIKHHLRQIRDHLNVTKTVEVVAWMRDHLEELIEGLAPVAAELNLQDGWFQNAQHARTLSERFRQEPQGPGEYPLAPTMESEWLVLRSFWGFAEGGMVDVVCSEIPEEDRPYFADPKDRNYLRYAKFADLDTLIYVRTHLSQLFPHLLVRDFSASEYFETSPTGLIAIGGPPWNSKFKEFQSQLPFHFIPHPLGEDDPLEVELIPHRLFRPSWSSDGNLLRDISLLVRLQLEGPARVFMLGGCLTLGVLGAAKAFLGGARAASNAGFLESLAQGEDFVIVWETAKIGGFATTADFAVAEPLVLLVRDPDSAGFRLVIDKSETAST